MQVNFEELARVKMYLREINNTPLDKIEWLYKGQKLDIKVHFIEDWKYVGLNNTDFYKCMFFGREIHDLFEN